MIPLIIFVFAEFGSPVFVQVYGKLTLEVDECLTVGRISSTFPIEKKRAKKCCRTCMNVPSSNSLKNFFTCC